MIQTSTGRQEESKVNRKGSNSGRGKMKEEERATKRRTKEEKGRKSMKEEKQRNRKE